MAQDKSNHHQKRVIIILLIIIAATAIIFVGRSFYNDAQRKECVKNLEAKYEDNLWLQNKIQATCNTK